MFRSTLYTLYTLIVATTVLLTACASDPEETLQPLATTDVAVAFVSSTQPLADTRAGVTYSMNDAQLQTTGIGVIAYYTANTPWASADIAPNFMYNQHVTYDGLDTHLWEYEPLKFWPNENQPADDQDDDSGSDPAMGTAAHSYVSFFAYAPYVNVTPSTGVPTSGSTTEGITALTANTVTGAPKVTYVLAHEAANQVDLLWGTRGKDRYEEADGTPNTSVTPVNTDLAKQKTSERVAFLFKHSLACIDVWVQRVYDETVSTGKTPAVTVPKVFVNKLQLHFDDDAMYADGKLNLANGNWEDTHGNAALTLTTSGDQQIAADLIGTDAANSNLTYVRNYELDDFSTKAGVTETRKRLTREYYATMFIPKADGITFTPSLSYSFVTQDDELALTTVTATDGTRYHRILHNNITGDPVTINPVEPGKRYTLICYIGAESVQFVIDSVEDWDFPIRMVPYVTGPTPQTIEHTLNED
ncbi:MAG: hypothetical protein IJ767_06565 [Bacteroidaceae bacterium]|nr:hypothetical protein [Bacteroidaceae bacterium]